MAQAVDRGKDPLTLTGHAQPPSPKDVAMLVHTLTVIVPRG